MEMEVRSVAEIEGCFVSLPLHLIQTLQLTSSSIFSFLALELRSLSKYDDVWYVAWSGSASSSSSSSSIQVHSLDSATTTPRGFRQYLSESAVHV